MYYFLTASLTKEERQDRKALFGSISDGLRSTKAYKWQTNEGDLVEIPVTTFPVLKTPFHFSYLFYIAQLSPALAKLYLRMALRMCRWTETQPSMLMHPLDFLSQDDVPSLKFFPAMGLPASRKLSLMGEMIDTLKRDHEIMTMGQHASHLLRTAQLPLVQPRFKAK